MLCYLLLCLLGVVIWLLLFGSLSENFIGKCIVSVWLVVILCVML